MKLRGGRSIAAVTSPPFLRAASRPSRAAVMAPRRVPPVANLHRREIRSFAATSLLEIYRADSLPGLGFSAIAIDLRVATIAAMRERGSLRG